MCMGMSRYVRDSGWVGSRAGKYDQSRRSKLARVWSHSPDELTGCQQPAGQWERGRIPKGATLLASSRRRWSRHIGLLDWKQAYVEFLSCFVSQTIRSLSSCLLLVLILGFGVFLPLDSRATLDTSPFQRLKVTRVIPHCHY